MHLFKHTHIHTYIHICIHTQTNEQTYIHAYIQTYIQERERETESLILHLFYHRNTNTTPAHTRLCFNLNKLTRPQRSLAIANLDRGRLRLAATALLAGLGR